MKARIKHTDTIIEVVREPFGWLWNSVEGRVYLDKDELVFLDDDNIDWQSFRAEAAKDILCSVLPKMEIIDGDFQQSIKNAIINSINVANELIIQLKEMEEK